MSPNLRLAYALLAGGLLLVGVVLIGTGVGRTTSPAGSWLGVALALGSALALAGAVAVAGLEARTARPW